MTANEEPDAVNTPPRARRTRRLLSRGCRGAGKAMMAPVHLLRRTGRAASGKPRTTVAVLTVFVVLLGAAGGYLWHEQRAADGVRQARITAVELAAREAPQLLSYDGKSIAKKVRQAKASLTEEFHSKYSELMRNVVGPAAKKQGIGTKASVTASSVVSASPDKVVCLLFVNQSTTAERLDSPKVSGSRVRVVLERPGDSWLISELKPI